MMGSRMAKNLQKVGFQIIPYDSDHSKLTDFSIKVSSLGELASRCNRFITMLPNNSAVYSLYAAKDSLLDKAPKGSTFIDCSTVSPDIEKQVNQICQSRGHQFIDAPVSGGVRGAEQATLSFLVGGDKAILKENKDLFLSMGKRVIHCGDDIGSGQIAKICNNLILGISMHALSEALNLAEKAGVDPKIMSEVINTSSGRSWCSELYNPVPGVMDGTPSCNQYTGGFAAALMAKDLALAVEEAKKVGVEIPTGTTTFESYQRLISQEKLYGGKDFSILYQYLKSRTI